LMGSGSLSGGCETGGEDKTCQRSCEPDSRADEGEVHDVSSV
jgi:hypothetical protein